MKTVYLAGKITGDPNYYAKFHVAACELEEAGFTVINPAILPPVGFDYAAYIRMSAAMMDECEAVCFLSDWKDSGGAKLEHSRATGARKEIFYFDEWLRKFKGAAASADKEAGQNGLQYAT